jgi:Family of unknown function (DUF6152)
MNSRIRAPGLYVLVAIALPALAHHSFSAEFDDKATITLTGAVTKVEWFNPHIWVYLDVKDAEGRPQHWQCEGGAPNSLVRNGWTKNSLKQGDEITIDGYLAKDGSKTCNAKKVTMADGKSVFAGSSAPTPK